MWGILTSMKSLCGEPVCLWLPQAYVAPGTSTYVQGVEVEENYAGPVPEGFDVISNIPPEEEGHGTGAGVGADGGADVVDLHPAFELRETGFHQIRHLTGILVASGMAHIALSVIVPTVSGALLHLVHNGLDHFAEILLLQGEVIVKQNELIAHNRAETQSPFGVTK